MGILTEKMKRVVTEIQLLLRSDILGTNATTSVSNTPSPPGTRLNSEIGVAMT
jgi:hypothetical protein